LPDGNWLPRAYLLSRSVLAMVLLVLPRRAGSLEASQSEPISPGSDAGL
jgi:hypothetical protein